MPCTIQWGLGQRPRSWEIFENFCVKSNLTVCKVAFNCKLQEKIGGAGWWQTDRQTDDSSRIALLPNNFAWGATAPSCFPGYRDNAAMQELSSVCLSVCHHPAPLIVANRYTLQQTFPGKWIWSTILEHDSTTFSQPTPTLSAQTPHSPKFQQVTNLLF